MNTLIAPRTTTNSPYPSATSTSTRASRTATADAGSTILVADDDPAIRGMEAEFLLGLGYNVLEAEDGESALQLAAGAKSVDLLITDFVMPGIDGLQLIRRLRDMYPDVPVLMVSGSLADVGAIVETFDHCETLGKPF